MEIVVKIEIHGEPEEVGSLLADLSGTLLEQSPEQEAPGADWWTSERASAFVRELTGPALRALRIIAEGAPSVSFRHVQQQMGMKGLQLAGRLSSIGFAVARVGGPVPFARDHYQRAYYIDPGVAKILKDAAIREQARRHKVGTE
jgi:hypothetical protein